MSANDAKQLWTVADYAKYHRVTERTVRNWLTKGISHVRVGPTGGRIRFVPPTSTGTSTNAA